LFGQLWIATEKAKKTFQNCFSFVAEFVFATFFSEKSTGCFFVNDNYQVYHCAVKLGEAHVTNAYCSVRNKQQLGMIVCSSFYDMFCSCFFQGNGYSELILFNNVLIFSLYLIFAQVSGS